MKVVAAMYAVRQQGCVCHVEPGSDGYFLIKHGTTQREKRIPLAVFLEMEKRALLKEIKKLAVQEQQKTSL